MTLRLGIFLAVVLAQVSVPLSFIVKHERTLAAGETHRFRTTPVDPVDPFQGRYVIVNLADQRVDIPADVKLGRLNRQRGFARIETDESGWTQFSTWHQEPPNNGSYLQTYLYQYGRFAPRATEDTGTHVIEIPFNRFYMTEDLAPLAEQLVRRRNEDVDCWVEVKVHRGHAVITGLYLDDRPIEQAIAEME